MSILKPIQIWKKKIFGVFKEEEGKFLKTLDEGKRELEKGIDPFILWTTYGFPVELTKEFGVVDMDDFNKKMKEHQNLSRTASEGMFKGGLGDTSEISLRYHTATHLCFRRLHRRFRKRKSLRRVEYHAGAITF